MEREKALLSDRIHYHRVSLMMAIAALAVLILSTFYAANDGTVLASWEVWLFDTINRLPNWLTPIFVLLTNIGTIGAVAVAGLIALVAKYRRIGLAILLSGGVAWYFADLLKDIIDRARPNGFLEDAIVRYSSLAAGYGFPSGHSAVGAACAMAIAMIVPRKYGIWLFLLALSVGISRVYLGVHLPLDVVSGWCIGIIVGYVIDLLLRVERVAVKNK